MRIVSVSGTLDSGKTTVIKKLITILAAQGKNSAVIVNEDGEETYDEDFYQQPENPGGASTWRLTWVYPGYQSGSAEKET